MAFYQILYWQRIPTQVKAWDDFDEVKREMPPGFMAQVDNEAQRQGLSKMEDYLAQLSWSDQAEREGEPEEVVDALVAELSSSHDSQPPTA